MTQIIKDTTLIAMLDVMTGGSGSTLHFCTAEPANYAGIALVELAQVAAGTWSITTDANGGTATCAEKTDITPTADGNALSLVISNSGAILCATDTVVSPLSITTPFTCPSFDLRIGNLA